MQQPQQRQQQRRQWGNPNTAAGDQYAGGRDLGGLEEPPFKMGMTPLNLGGIGDLAGVTEIETLDLGGGSRRGSFSKPREPSTGHSRERQGGVNTSAIGIPRPNTGQNYDALSNKQRP